MSHFTTHDRIRKILHAGILAALISPGVLFAADPKIDIDVVQGGGGYKLDFLNSECPDSPGYKGCIKVGTGSKNWIMWELTKKATRAGWVFSALQMDIDSLPSNIRNCAIQDFNLDPGTGYANDFRVQGNGKFAKNWNENGCNTAYEVNYLIFAENRETGEQADSDPIIRNGGRN